jgi:deoxyribodipyrimidine photo-lyase
MILQRFAHEFSHSGARSERLLVGAFSGDRFLPRPFAEAEGTPQGELWKGALLGRAHGSAQARGSTGTAGTGRYVVYWMMQNRRVRRNAALYAAQCLAKCLEKPLLVVEGLTSNYPWVSERHHSFVAQGVADRMESSAPLPGYVFVGIGRHASTLERGGCFGPPSGLPENAFDVSYLGSGEPPANAGVLPALFEGAVAVVTDWAPWYIFPGLAARTCASLTRRGIPLLLVDDCGVVPLACFPKVEAAARFLRPKLLPHMEAAAAETAALDAGLASFTSWATPLDVDPEGMMARAAKIAPVDKAFVRGSCGACPAREGPQGAAFVSALCAFAGVDGSVSRVPTWGGEAAARARFESFLAGALARYDADRNHPDLDGTSRMSAYLHYGMIHPRDLLARAREFSHGNGELEAAMVKYFDELVTWRELGLNMARFAYEAGLPLGSVEHVPAWARKTLVEHMGRPGSTLTLAELEDARTPDPVWNAAQRELARTGALHNYMRMLWGKGVVSWSTSPEEALSRLEYLNNKYALDGRDPNSYTGIYWCLGKFDRPWPPARPPFGITRSMSTRNARKKLSMEKYLAKFGPP